MLAVYLWAPSFLRKQPSQSGETAASGLFATSSMSLTGTITQMTEMGFVLEIPASALDINADEVMRTRRVQFNPDTPIVRFERRTDIAQVEAEQRRYVALQTVNNLSQEDYAAALASSSLAAAPTTTVVTRVGEINPALPVEYRTAPAPDFATYVASATARLVGTSTWTPDVAPTNSFEVPVDRAELKEGVVVTVISFASLYEALDITAEKIIVTQQ